METRYERHSDSRVNRASSFLHHLSLLFPLLAASWLLLLPALAWWNGAPPLGDDASSHIVLYARVAEAIDTGAGWWAPDFNLGFPIGLYYQPLPHVVGGFVTWLFGGGAAAVTAYKLISVLLIALWPWGVYVGARALGMSRTAAVAAGVSAPLVISVLGFGLTLRSSLILALHTQAWAAPLLPITLGQMARVLRGERRAWPWAVLSWSLLALCHFFYGVATAAIVSVWVLCEPRRVVVRAARAVGAGALVALSLLFWLVPLLTTLESMGGWPFGNETRTEGYGVAGFMEPLLSGALLDGEAAGHWLRAIPVLSLVAAAGLVLCFARPGPRGRASVDSTLAQRFVPAAWLIATFCGLLVLVALVTGAPLPIGLAAWAGVAGVVALCVRLTPIPGPVPRLLISFALVSALFTIGRAGLGPLVDLFPFNRTVQMFRYLGLFHLAAVLLVGHAVGVVLERARRPAPRSAVLIALVLLLVAPVGRALGELQIAFRTIDDVDVDLEAYDTLVAAQAHETERNGAGRIFVHPSSGLHGHFHSALLALWEASDAGQSYGVGLHDSLNFYYLEFFHPEDADDSTLLELYGFQYVAASDWVDFADTGATIVLRAPGYRLWRLDRRVPLCSPVFSEGSEGVAATEVRAGHAQAPINASGGPLVGYPRALRELGRAWLNGNGPTLGVHPLVAIPPGLGLGDSTDAPVRVDAEIVYDAPLEPVGSTQLAQRSPDRHVCRVDMRAAGAVLFRVGYHPFWRAEVDGRPADLRYALPAFSAIEVGPGEHEVTIRYQLPGYVPPLIAFGLCVPIGVAAAARRGGRKRSSRRSRAAGGDSG